MREGAHHTGAMGNSEGVAAAVSVARGRQACYNADAWGGNQMNNLATQPNRHSVRTQESAASSPHCLPRLVVPAQRTLAR